MNTSVRRAFVRVLIRDPAGRILVVSHKSSGRRTLNLPGGKVEPGEAPVTAARREVLEETNIMLRSLTLLHEDDFFVGSAYWHGYFFEGVPLEDEAHNREPHKLSSVEFVDIPIAQARGNKTFLVELLHRWVPEIADTSECQQRLIL
jgi:8-oxo-dGTP pyrophosphatase MutT (NUDIX family)